jgi:hypothetical protein
MTAENSSKCLLALSPAATIIAGKGKSDEGTARGPFLTRIEDSNGKRKYPGWTYVRGLTDDVLGASGADTSDAVLRGNPANKGNYRNCTRRTD